MGSSSIKNINGKHCIAFVATGDKYINEAARSASLSRKYSSNLFIIIVADNLELALSFGVFDCCLAHPCPRYNYRDKITGIKELLPKVDQLLFLDSDAFIIHDVGDLLKLCNVSDFAAVRAPVRHPKGWSDKNVPYSFPEVNSGVLFLRNTKKIIRLLTKWLKLYDNLFENYKQVWDQASLRSVLWPLVAQSKIRYINLPSEYNLRIPKPWVIGRGLAAHIIHGRFSIDELEPFISYLNDDIDRFRSSAEWVSLNPQSTIKAKFDRGSHTL